MQALKTLLIANRGEISVRCIKACKKLGIETVSLYTAADSGSLHVSLATRSVLLDEDGSVAFSNIDNILRICQDQNADAVFAGYGFLSESAEFARRVEERHMVFVGPDAASIEAMGMKHTAREIATASGVPVIEGSGLLSSSDDAVEASKITGLPVMLKASGGGGGMGTQVCWSEEEVRAGFSYVKGRAQALFKDTGVFLERFYPKCHHIEVQIFGNGSTVIHFGERECSIQRRLQKVVEECPSPHLSDKPELRKRLLECALSLSKAINYRSAGTVEFLVDDESHDYFFLEMNTRLQVEHGISELCYGVDIVELMLKQADYQLIGAGGIPTKELLPLQTDQPVGAAIEVRVCCENPAADFLPSSGLIQQLQWPRDDLARVDTWIQAGTQVSSDFDSLLGKIMVHGDNRDLAVGALVGVLQNTKIGGVVNNLTFLRHLTSSQVFRKGHTLTSFLPEQYKFSPVGFQVANPGGYTTIQQARNRNIKGFGIPNGGPMDDLSATLANLIVGNSEDTECLEVIMMGPELVFLNKTVISVCGADLPVTLDGKPIEMWSRIQVQPNQKLKLGIVSGHGCCCYIAFKGGFPSAADWLGSKSTTPSLGLGGLQGRVLKHGDYIELMDSSLGESVKKISLPAELRPPLDVTSIYAMHGPHDSAEFITKTGRHNLYSTTWKVNHNCSRTGIRLDGPAIEWARESGGAAGAHPSNVVDYPYPSPGGVNWTGDSPAIFPRDAPDLGGFLCSSTIPSADLWKLGQIKPGHAFRFLPVTYDMARKLAKKKRDFIAAVREFLAQSVILPVALVLDKEEHDTCSVLKKVKGTTDASTLTIRQAGDTAVLVDLGFQNATLETSVRANNLASAIQVSAKKAISIRINISSILLEFDPNLISQADIVNLVESSRDNLERVDVPMKCRLLRLPIAFGHPALKESEERYTKLIRSKASYLPDGVKYVQENNGLVEKEDVFRILSSHRFVVVAVGFMTGLPLMLPLDPRVRLSAQKYNPPRTSTPPGTVGLGGRSFCIYPADQPGGYMPIARSIPVWDTFSLRKGFSDGQPWLCEPFDLVEFYEVDLVQYSRIEKAFESGTWEPLIEDATFDGAGELANEAYMESSPEGREFDQRQKAAAAEMARREQKLYTEWKAETAKYDGNAISEDEEGSSGIAIMSPHQGKVWKSLVKLGDKISKGQTVAILESMKMEIPIVATEAHDGLIVSKIIAKEGVLVYPGNAVATVAN